MAGIKEGKGDGARGGGRRCMEEELGKGWRWEREEGMQKGEGKVGAENLSQDGKEHEQREVGGGHTREGRQVGQEGTKREEQGSGSPLRRNGWASAESVFPPIVRILIFCSAFSYFKLYSLASEAS